MPLTAASFLAPTGDVTADLFPDDADAATLTARLDAYLADATARAATIIDAGAQTRAITAWVYHRVYRAVHLRLSASAATISVEGEVQRTFLIQQIQNFKVLAAEQLALFEAQAPVAASAPPRLASESLSTLTSW